MIITPATPSIPAVRQAGAGELVSSKRRYLLGALTYVGPSGGRGVLDLELGPGDLLLSGRDADQISATTWRLKIDMLRLGDERPVVGTCDLGFTSGGRGYAKLTCRGVIRPDAEPFAVTWRGDGSPSRQLTSPPEKP